MGAKNNHPIEFLYLFSAFESDRNYYEIFKFKIVAFVYLYLQANISGHHRPQFVA
jgi:hypothetical protein